MIEIFWKHILKEALACEKIILEETHSFFKISLFSYRYDVEYAIYEKSDTNRKFISKLKTIQETKDNGK